MPTVDTAMIFSGKKKKCVKYKQSKFEQIKMETWYLFGGFGRKDNLHQHTVLPCFTIGCDVCVGKIT